jgi:hypothetical protein
VPRQFPAAHGGSGGGTHVVERRTIVVTRDAPASDPNLDSGFAASKPAVADLEN